MMKMRLADKVSRGARAGRSAAVSLVCSLTVMAVVTLGSTAAMAQESKTIVLTGGMLISGLSVPPLHNATVVIRGDRVVAVGPAAEIRIPAGAKVIDTSGQTMLPGLIDAHAHLFMIGFGDEAGWFKWLETTG
ncbi:MAG: amidohydrolase family protein, partial [Sandarakinorhabdus sp.]